MMISNETAAQIVADSHLPGIQNDTVARTVGFDFWQYNGTIPWGNDTRPDYIVYEANPETLSVNRTHTLAFISYAGDHAFLMPKNDTSDKYVWVVRDFRSNERYAYFLHRDFYLYFVDAFSGKILAYGCASCGVCT
ncbi:hypothetical protein [Candidatus Nitrososphaera evergladensis]|nr:hypothetical protein [Candidatus Nitrososphaera evergladensis]